MSDKDFNNIVQNQNDTNQAAKNAPEFGIQRIYIKDLSFEAPRAPEIFRADWTPEVALDLSTVVNNVAENAYEVVLKVTVTVKAKEKIAFLIEVQQAGIFTLKGFSKDQLGPMLGSFCPNILFPYVREVVSDVVNRGTFPPLYLAPINFDSLYQQHLTQQQQQPQSEGKNSTQQDGHAANDESDSGGGMPSA